VPRAHEAQEDERRTDEPGDRDRRAGEERGRREHGGGGAVEVDPQRGRGLLAEGVCVDARREEQRGGDADRDDERCDHELGPADDGHATLKPPEDGAQAEREAVARDEHDGHDGAGERREHDAAEEHRQHGGPPAEARETPDERDRDHRAGERGERHDGRGRAGRDGDDRAERRAR
jgi:hypothetical protein